MRRSLVAAAAALFAAGAVIGAGRHSGVAPVAPVAPVAAVAPVAPGGLVAPVAPGGLVLAVPHTLTVALTASGCSPAMASLPAGPVTVQVQNSGTPGVSEAELAGPSGVVLAEAEGVGPGLAGSFSLTLASGHYTVHCQSSARGSTSLDLTATAPQHRVLTADQADIHRLLQAAAGGYATYVREEVEKLATTTDAFAAAIRTAAIRTAAIPLAKSRYAAARVHYERIESVAESFAQLDAMIDERVNDVPAGQAWLGFHRLENDLWGTRDLSGAAPIADELSLSVANLKVVVDRETVQPAQLADGAAALLSEVGASKITGEEERYSHLDALDLSANVTGAGAAARLLMPGLARLDPTGAATLARRFAVLDGVVAGIPQAARIDWRRATPELKARLSAAVDAAAAPLAAVAAEVAAA